MVLVFSEKYNAKGIADLEGKLRNSVLDMLSLRWLVDLQMTLSKNMGIGRVSYGDKGLASWHKGVNIEKRSPKALYYFTVKTLWR